MLMAIASNQTVAENGIIPLITTVQQGCSAKNDAGSITLKAGRYLISVGVTATGDGLATIQLLKNGQAVLGAKSSMTLTSSGTGTETSISASFSCCFTALLIVDEASANCSRTLVQLQVQNVGITVESATVTVIKVM